MNFWQKYADTFRSWLYPSAPRLRPVRHFPSYALGREVAFDVYLPPGYRFSRERRYPLALFNDGQDLPRMDFSGTLEWLYSENKLPPIIAVGIHAGSERQREYGTARQPDYKGRGDRAARYRDFVLEELLPYLFRHYRLSGRREETGFAGFSLGGLSALDIAWAYPQIFGVAGVFSGSLWWRSSDVDPRDPDADRIMHEIVHQTAQPDESQRFWFQCGTLDEEEDRNQNQVIDAIDDTLDLIGALQAKGFSEKNIRYLQIEEGRHDSQTWGLAMPDFLTWAFQKSRES